MSFIWAIVTGVILSYIFKSGWFFFIGLFVGPALYRAFNRIAPVGGNQPSPTLFLTVAFEVLGHLSKAKGKVTQDDIDAASRFMEQLQLDNEKRKLAQESFNQGKSSNYPLRERLRELYTQYRLRRKVLNVFCEQLIQAAISDGELHPREEDILYIVAQEFHIPRAQMAMYIQMMMASYEFQRQQQSKQSYQDRYQHQDESQNQYQKQYQKEQRYQHQQRSYQYESSHSNINNAYRILGVDPSADSTTIKRAYRKLMNEHHPDKLVSKGLPKEMLESAKRRTQEIQSAYDLIKSQRGFK